VLDAECGWEAMFTGDLSYANDRIPIDVWKAVVSMNEAEDR
jgi:hypothetical protein